MRFQLNFVNLCCQRFNVSRMKSRLWPKLKRRAGVWIIYGDWAVVGLDSK